ncbi:hypothetical protein WDW37_02395 [Bdellovibrionota bacterium FG-1]
MKNKQIGRKTNEHYSSRIRLEKLKLKSWRLYVLAKVLVILADAISYYLRQP